MWPFKKSVKPKVNYKVVSRKRQIQLHCWDIEIHTANKSYKTKYNSYIYYFASKYGLCSGSDSSLLFFGRTVEPTQILKEQAYEIKYETTLNHLYYTFIEDITNNTVTLPVNLITSVVVSEPTPTELVEVNEEYLEKL